jgi:hypothetical protein
VGGVTFLVTPPAISVATHLESPSRSVTMNVTMGSLADGTVYTAGTQLSLPAEKLVVDVANSGYRKM